MFQSLIIIISYTCYEVANEEKYVLCFNSSFTGMTPQGRERKRRVCQKLWHEETTTVLRLSIYMGVLSILKEYVMVFQVGVNCAWNYCNFTARACTSNVVNPSIS